MYLVNGRYVTADEARKLRGLDKTEEVSAEPKTGDVGQPKKTKKDIIAELTANGIDFNPNAKKEELEKLLLSAPAAPAAPQDETTDETPQD